MLIRRGVNLSPHCVNCHQGLGSIPHIFCECPLAMNLWQTLPSPSWVFSFLHDDFLIWLKENLKHDQLCCNMNIPWAIVFAFESVWQLTFSRVFSCLLNQSVDRGV